MKDIGDYQDFDMDKHSSELDLDLMVEVHNVYELVRESGIHTHADVLQLGALGVHCFLVGEALMRQPDVEAATRTLLGG
jgi:indole-3-glycerol phosphate synthase